VSGRAVPTVCPFGASVPVLSRPRSRCRRPGPPRWLYGLPHLAPRTARHLRRPAPAPASPAPAGTRPCRRISFQTPCTCTPTRNNRMISARIRTRVQPCSSSQPCARVPALQLAHKTLPLSRLKSSTHIGPFERSASAPPSRTSCATSPPALPDRKFTRDVRVFFPTREPLRGLQPQLFTSRLLLRRQPASLRIPHSSGHTATIRKRQTPAATAEFNISNRVNIFRPCLMRAASFELPHHSTCHRHGVTDIRSTLNVCSNSSGGQKSRANLADP